jgi:hypothetical protein
MSLVDRDLAFMLAGFDSKAVCLGSWVGRAIVDEMDVLDVDSGGEPVMVRRTVVRLPREDFLDDTGKSTVTRGTSLTIDGVTWTVADVRVGAADGSLQGMEVDGRELHLVVRRVTR